MNQFAKDVEFISDMLEKINPWGIYDEEIDTEPEYAELQKFIEDTFGSDWKQIMELWNRCIMDAGKDVVDLVDAANITDPITLMNTLKVITEE